MKHTLIELVDVILQHLKEQPGIPHTENGIRKWLASQGYQKRDIDAAMKLVASKFSEPAQIEPRSMLPVRALAAVEANKLLPEARDALIRLDCYGLITPEEREMILDQVINFDGRVGLDELDYLLSWIVCGGRDYESQQTVFNVMEGQTDVFH